MKKVVSTLIGTLALLALIIQPTSFTTTQSAHAIEGSICDISPNFPWCGAPICMPNAFTACTSSENVCGETSQWTYDCQWVCNATPPVPADINENGTPDCNEEHNQCVEWAWNECVSQENVCGDTAYGTINCDGSCSAITPTPADENENGTPDCNETPYVDGQIVKTANTSVTTIWSPITYTLTYSNIGNTSTNNGVYITDVLPEGTTVQSASQEYEQEGNVIYFSYEWLGAGQTGTITITLNTTGTVQGVLTNTATIDVRCYIVNRELYTKSVSKIVSLPIIMQENNSCDNNTQNNSSSANVTMIQQWGWFGWGQWGGGWGGSTTPTTVSTGSTWWTLLETGAPKEVDHTCDAYDFAKENDITKILKCEDARLTDNILRAEVAKMVSKFYKNVLKKDIVHLDVCNPSNYKDNASMDTETRWFVYDVCSLGLMWWQNDKSHILDAFRPMDKITVAEFSTILSRMLYHTISTTTTDEWYLDHFTALKDHGIMDIFPDPFAFEVRWNVLNMLLKASSIIK